MNWGDEDQYFERVKAKIKLSEATDVLFCSHCHNPYDAADEDDEARYGGLCLGCAEHFRSLDQEDELIIAAEDGRIYG